MSSVAIIGAVIAALVSGGGLAAMITAIVGRRGRRATVAQTYTDTALSLIGAVKADATSARLEASEVRREAAEARRETAEMRRALATLNIEVARIQHDLVVCGERLGILVSMIRNPQTTMEDLRAEIAPYKTEEGGYLP